MPISTPPPRYTCDLCLGGLIFVHGHYQREQCHWVALTCCDGEMCCPD